MRVGRRFREMVLDRDRYTCQRCGASWLGLKPGERRVSLEVDHIYPRVLGGSNNILNLQTLCRPCNAKKAAQWQPEEAEVSL